MAISLVFLCVCAAVTLFMAITIAFRMEREAETYVFTKAVKKFDEIMEIAQVLPELEGKERRAACRASFRPWLVTHTGNVPKKGPRSKSLCWP